MWRSIHYEGLSAAEPQPKWKGKFYHEDHEGRMRISKFEISTLRVLRALRG